MQAETEGEASEERKERSETVREVYAQARTGESRDRTRKEVGMSCASALQTSRTHARKHRRKRVRQSS